MRPIGLPLLLAAALAAPLSPVFAADTPLVVAQRESSPNPRSGGDTSDELRTFFEKEIAALRSEMAALRSEMSAMRAEMGMMRSQMPSNMKK
ncbi:hypothetical protein [Gloeobacter morelensis]|uniref:Uncharacterized protein n=1 Tax=Gloeobacter morelensis MG652769 TaxID=2781736 RepID=A0ABY3PMT3_9CYAN|nr:hypothetical protein [Gloeobacter morelensis]UFP94930.1 hypothetical protein ISF26_01395 [Gloeobacter morelensis MG652769]